MQLSSNKSYGLLIITILVLTGLWLGYDAQTSIFQPGWFAGLRSSVWCRTVVYGPGFGSATLFHYPGKSLERVMEELSIPWPIRTLYLEAEKEETLCFDTWKEAARSNARFIVMTQDYADVLADWTEEDYQQAVIMINLHRDGAARLNALLQVRQRSLEQSQQR